MQYVIRKAKLDDMKSVMRAHKLSIEEICSKDYTSEQIAKWADVNYSNDFWEKSVQEENHFLIEVANSIEGFCHSMVHENGDGEIKGLYFTKVINGRGIGREVFELSIDFLRQNRCPKVFIFATKTAKGFYEKMGFVEIDQLLINVRGADLECFKMEKNLI
jgi:putative acetyltransferase